MRSILVAVLAMVAGMAVGYLFCRVTVQRLRRRVRTLRRGQEPQKMGVMDKILILEAVVLALYTVTTMWIFYKVGAEPVTLTGCVFGVCGLENGVMGWIKTNKDKEPSGRGKKTPAAEMPPVERPEPPDIGL
ncbi:MAG: hypothetical protein RR350_02355 [Oscillibacter sp.]